MRVFLCCSKHLYHKIPPVKEALEQQGHTITLPNSYDNPYKEEQMKKEGPKTHNTWKASMLHEQGEKVARNDAILVLNYEKNGQQNYIGGATFLEIFKAFELEKKIFLMNPIPDNIFKDELSAIQPIILHGDLSQIK